ncbi:hypothetical protein [Nostoc sp.]|uniref:hypothetical protein n=1 Tax=Nostoc sp. TaxID=1180 RepID=UPI002FF425CA
MSEIPVLSFQLWKINIKMINLQIGSRSETIIDANKYWNATGIYLEIGATYRFEVEGEQFWCDAWIRSDADGYTQPWLSWAEMFRRKPKENWFSIIGNIGQSGEQEFLIGKKLEKYKATSSGELFCYANDVPIMYFNNRGTLSLTITRLS